MGNYNNTLFFKTYEVNIQVIDSWMYLVDGEKDELDELRKELKPIETEGLGNWADEEIIDFAMEKIEDYLSGSIKDISYTCFELKESSCSYTIVVAGIK